MMRIMVVVLVMISAASAQLPNPKLTPGAVRTTSTQDVCTQKAQQFRNTTAAMKKQVCRAYGVANCPQEGTIEIDHLISLEIGGADSTENLWPEFAKYADGSPGFHVKDKLENELHREVCSGKMKLMDAQNCIRSNWMNCYERVFGERATTR